MILPAFDEVSKLGPSELFIWCLTTPAPAVRLGFRLFGEEVCMPSLPLHVRASLTGPELLGKLTTADGRPMFGRRDPEDVLSEAEAHAIATALPGALAALEPGEPVRARLRAGARMADLLGTVLGNTEGRDLHAFFGLPILNLTRLHWEAWMAARKVFQS